MLYSSRAIIATLVMLSACELASADKWKTKSMAPDDVLTYRSVGGVDLDLHIFHPEGWSPEDRRTAVVFFFGGGWNGGSPSQFYPHAWYLAQRGIIGIAADYRVKSRHNVTPFECVEDGKAAIRYVRANADRLGVDPNRIVAGGGSAGGHVAACTGTIDGFVAGGNHEVSSVPNAMMLFNPVADTSKYGYGNGRLGERWQEISPVHHVDAQTPPTIIFHGMEDTTVPVENVERFELEMRKVGVACALYVFDGHKHGFFNYSRNPEIFITTMQLSTNFLRSLGMYPEEEFHHKSGIQNFSADNADFG